MDWNPGPGTAVFAEFFLKTTLILVPALLAGAALKRRPAAFRHFILSLALIGLLLVPLLSFLPVGWRTSLLPVRPAGAAEIEHPSTPGFSPGDPVLLSESAFKVGAGDRVTEGLSGFPASEEGPGPAEGRQGSRRENSGPVPERSFLDGLVIFLWAGGLGVLILRLAAGLAGAFRLTKEGTGLGDPAWRILIARFLSIVPLRRSIRLRSHPEVVVPLTWGWRKPVILMPAGAEAWAETERSSAIFHELSHVKRADFLVLLFVRASLAVFWWNPVCWLVYFRIRIEQEIACDELVLRAGIKPSTYAASLLAIRHFAGFRWKASSSLPGMLGRSSFKGRLAAILTQNMLTKEVKMKSRIMIAASIILAVAFIGTARPAVGIETNAENSLAVWTAPETTAVSAVVQEKDKEKVVEEKDKTTAKKADILIDKGDKARVEIMIVGDGETKKLLLDKPVTIKTDKEGKTIVIGADGVEYPVVTDAPIRLRIKEGDAKLIKEGKILKIDENDFLTIPEEGGKVLVIEKSGDGKLEKKITGKIEIDENDIDSDLDVIKEMESGQDGVKVIVRKKKKDGKDFAWTIAESGGDPLFFVHEKDKDLLEKVTAIREQAEAVKAKKLEFEELEKSLKKLEAELKAKDEEMKKLTATLKISRNAWTIDEDDRDMKIVTRVKEGDVTGDADRLTVICQRKDGTLRIVFTGAKGQEGRAAYDRVLDKLKKGLPEGGKLLESNYNEESGAMTFKFDASAGAAADEGFVKKLIESVSAETKK